MPDYTVCERVGDENSDEWCLQNENKECPDNGYFTTETLGCGVCVPANECLSCENLYSDSLGECSCEDDFGCPTDASTCQGGGSNQCADVYTECRDGCLFEETCAAGSWYDETNSEYCEGLEEVCSVYSSCVPSDCEECNCQNDEKSCLQGTVCDVTYKMCEDKCLSKEEYQCEDGEKLAEKDGTKFCTNDHTCDTTTTTTTTTSTTTTTAPPPTSTTTTTTSKTTTTTTTSTTT